MARGNRREAIFLDDDDRRFFLQCLAEACEKTGWRVHAWVLMANHYHLFIETPEGNLVEGMKWLQNTVTRRFNVRHRKWGRLFGDRYKSVLVEGAQANYYARLWDYIHLNPFRAGLLRAREGASILDYPWSSIAGGYALLPRRPLSGWHRRRDFLSWAFPIRWRGGESWWNIWTEEAPKREGEAA
jgi:REP-associated tyrosine transposase